MKSDVVKDVSPLEKAWPADKVERRPVSDLIPYARNSRTHSDEQIAQIAASIKEWGWTVPVLIEPDGGIIAGHGRIMAAQRLGITDVPCMVAEGWSEAQKRAYVIADNKLSDNSEFDRDMLVMELQELEHLKFDLNMTGFSVEEMDGLFFEPNFEPGTEDDQGSLDTLAPKMVECPHCGGEFDLREHGEG